MSQPVTDLIRNFLDLPDLRPGQPEGLWSYAVPPLCGLLLPPIIRRVGASWKIKWVGLHNLRSIASSSNWILASWHEALLMNMFGVRDNGAIAIISPSWEGEIIAQTMSGLGFGLARGSSGHQPMHAIRETVRLLKAGETIGWVLDGPVGPRREVKQGILQIASLARRPILPMHSIAEQYWQLPSWDRQVIPKPGTRVTIGFGEPLNVPKGVRNDSLAEYTTIMQNRLNELEQQLVTVASSNHA